MSVSEQHYQQSPSSSKSGMKKPLFSLEAEQAVLGGLMLDARAWERIAGHVTAVDFYMPAHGHVFDVVLELVDKQQPIDVLTVTERLKHKHLLEQVGGESVIFELSLIHI